VSVRAAAVRLIALDPQTGLYHRAVMVGDAGPYCLEGCEVESLLRASIPADCNKRLLHDCLFRREEG